MIARLAPASPFLETCPFFDADGYDYSRRCFGKRVPARGGARRRLFWPTDVVDGSRAPFLPKVPLVRWSARTSLAASTHQVAKVRLAPMVGALLHFKLFADFVDDVRSEVERAEHWDAAGQYAAYAAGLAEHPNLSAWHSGSVEYVDTRQLVELGLIRVGRWPAKRTRRRMGR